jgi:hypothetical protein
VLRGGYPEALTRSTDSFVCAELLKHASTPARQHASTSARQHVSTAEGDFQLLYDRDADQVEVDVVIENAESQVVGVEIKSSATVTSCTPPSLANTLASAIGWLM